MQGQRSPCVRSLPAHKSANGHGCSARGGVQTGEKEALRFPPFLLFVLHVRKRPPKSKRDRSRAQPGPSAASRDMSRREPHGRPGRRSQYAWSVPGLSGARPSPATWPAGVRGSQTGHGAQRTGSAQRASGRVTVVVIQLQGDLRPAGALGNLSRQSGKKTNF